MLHSSSARACGLDFGTSNSTVGCVRPEQETLLPLEDGKVTLPSVVFFNADDGSTCFGRAALQEKYAGAAALPFPVRLLMRGAADVMRTLAYRV